VKYFQALALLLWAPLAAQAAQASPPNIVLIVGDDVGYSDLGSYGGEISTPNLDALAAQGVRFSNFHVTASCSPSRSMLMTGVDNHLNGLGNMDITMPFEHKGKPGYEGELNEHVVTVAQLLRDNGYHTYQVGKWHLGNAPEKRPFNRGFERTIALGDTGADNWEQRSYLPVYDKAHWYADGVEHQLPDDFYSSQYFVDKAIEFIDSNGDDGKPFFTYLGFQAVHIPIQAPAEFVEKYQEHYQQGWSPIRKKRMKRAIELGLMPASTELVEMSSTQDWAALDAIAQAYNARRMAVYAGMLDAMDFHVGRLVAHLKETGAYDNTVFIFLSDNGPEPSDPLQVIPLSAWIKFNYSIALEDLGKKGAYASIGPSWANAAASPGTFYKFFAGEGGVRVPLIITGPGLSSQHAIERSFAHIKDIVPTILGLSGTSDPLGQYAGKPVMPITGSSLLPVLRGEAKLTHAPDKAIGYELAGNAALYKGDYKLLKNLPPLGDGQWHLYNIVADPGEARDLREALPSLYQEMIANYQTYAAEHGVQAMPEGYDYIKQATRYSTVKILQRNALTLMGVAVFFLVLIVALTRRHLRRRHARSEA
jgi:arylsulfatase A-like enzyme